MIRSFVAQAGALLASATLAFLLIAPVAAPSAQGRVLSFTVPDACTLSADGGGGMIMTCGSTPPPSTFSCSLTAPSQVAANSPFNVTMSCNGGTLPYQYQWNPVGANGAQLSTTITVNTIFNVTATDAAGATSTKSVTVNVSSGGGGGGGGSIASCTNAGYTVLGGAPINITWGQSMSANSGPFGNSQVWLFSLTVPQGTPQTSAIGYFNVVENGGSPTTRQMFVSTTPCDFQDLDATASQGVTATVYYNTVLPTAHNGGYKNLVPNTTYYITVRNFDYQSNLGTCPSNNCFAIMNAQPQH
jgi:hypothetical protein